MGAKFELVVYLFKDVEKTRSTEWRDNMVLRGGPVTWKIIKRSFLDRFFRKELTLINLSREHRPQIFNLA